MMLEASLCIWVFSSYAFSLTFGNVRMDQPGARDCLATRCAKARVRGPSRDGPRPPGAASAARPDSSWLGKKTLVPLPKRHSQPPAIGRSCNLDDSGSCLRWDRPRAWAECHGAASPLCACCLARSLAPPPAPYQTRHSLAPPQSAPLLASKSRLASVGLQAESHGLRAREPTGSDLVSHRQHGARGLLDGLQHLAGSREMCVT